MTLIHIETEAVSITAEATLCAAQAHTLPDYTTFSAVLYYHFLFSVALFLLLEWLSNLMLPRGLYLGRCCYAIAFGFLSTGTVPIK
jgi:hypothetical protein